MSSEEARSAMGATDQPAEVEGGGTGAASPFQRSAPEPGGILEQIDRWLDS